MDRAMSTTKIQRENTTAELAGRENLRVNSLDHVSTGATIMMHISDGRSFTYPLRHRPQPSQLGYTAAKTKTTPHEEMVMSHPIPSCRFRLLSPLSHQSPTLMKSIRVPCSRDIPSDEGLVSIASPPKLHSLRYGSATHRRQDP